MNLWSLGLRVVGGFASSASVSCNRGMAREDSRPTRCGEDFVVWGFGWAFQYPFHARKLSIGVGTKAV